MNRFAPETAIVLLLLMLPVLARGAFGDRHLARQCGSLIGGAADAFA
jgi:hypothetical protein